MHAMPSSAIEQNPITSVGHFEPESLLSAVGSVIDLGCGRNIDPNSGDVFPGPNSIELPIPSKGADERISDIYDGLAEIARDQGFIALKPIIEVSVNDPELSYTEQVARDRRGAAFIAILSGGGTFDSFDMTKASVVTSLSKNTHPDRLEETRFVAGDAFVAHPRSWPIGRGFRNGNQTTVMLKMRDLA